MLRRSTSRTAIVLTSAAALAAACASSPQEEPTGSRGGFRDGRSASAPEPVGISELDTVYFDLDRAEIREDAKPILRTNASEINREKSWDEIVLEGHCDERGSEEYNLALGERRANGVKRYLVGLGVAASRIATVSYGESQPAVRGHNELAWKHNRRVEFALAR